MSRIGKQQINVPSGVKVSIETSRVVVEGKRGTLEVPVPDRTRVELSDSVLEVKRSDDTRQSRALHGLTRALLANAVHGVEEGFVKKLDVVGIGYRAEVKGKYLNLTLGHSHPTAFPVPEGIEISVVREPRSISNYVTTISIGGHDRQCVGQIAADIRALRPPDAYKGKGVRYSDEEVRTKVGKKGA